MRTGFSISGVVLALLSALLLALLLAGCAAEPGRSARNGTCRVHRDTAMAMTRLREFMLLPASIGDRQVRMVLDTGAEVSTMSPSVASAFHLAEDLGRGRLLRGVGGDVQAGSVVVDRFAIGTLLPARVRLSVGPGNLLPGQTPPVAGLLGTDLLDGHDLDLDAPGGTASLYTVTNCPHFRPWSEDPAAAAITETALTRTSTGLGFVIANFDGSAVRALLDTGARTSFMTKRLASSLGITDEMLEDDPVSVKIGISRSEIDVRQHRFDRISLGAVTWRDVPVGVADIDLPGVDMLLGADLLGQQRVWISAARGMLWLR